MARSIRLSGYKKGERDEGKLHFPNRGAIEYFAKKLGDGVRVILEIREDESEHVKSHKGYYFAVVVKHVAIALKDVCGYPIDPGIKSTLDSTHDWLKKEFLDNSVEVKNSFGETITLPPSTTRLDDEGWKMYLTRIIIFAAEVWVYVIPVKMPKFYFPTDEPKFNHYKEIAARMGG